MKAKSLVVPDICRIKFPKEIEIPDYIADYRGDGLAIFALFIMLGCEIERLDSHD